MLAGAGSEHKPRGRTQRPRIRGAYRRADRASSSARRASPFGPAGASARAAAARLRVQVAAEGVHGP